MKPIIFILGPSGVGKSYLSKKLKKKKFLYIHIDTDRESRTFAANDFPSEWDNDFQKLNLSSFVINLRNRFGDEYAGAVVSFPTVFIFRHTKLAEAVQLGVTPILLWGKQKHCMRAAQKRIEKKEMSFNLPRYKEKNDLAFQTYCQPEYDAFRVEAFREDGSRFQDEEWLPLILKLTTTS